MAARAREQNRATYDDLLKAPDHLIAELIDGELFTSPRPAGPHSRAMSALNSDLFAAYDRGRGGPGGWWIFIEPELHLGEEVMVPDLAGWRRSTMPVPPTSHIFDIRPDWICEVLSPSTRRIDRGRKMPLYAAHAVPHAWIVAPEDQLVEILVLKDAHWSTIATHSGDEKFRAEPFPEAEIDLSIVWFPAAP